MTHCPSGWAFASQARLGPLYFLALSCNTTPIQTPGIWLSSLVPRLLIQPPGICIVVCCARSIRSANLLRCISLAHSARMLRINPEPIFLHCFASSAIQSLLARVHLLFDYSVQFSLIQSKALIGSASFLSFANCLAFHSLAFSVPVPPFIHSQIFISVPRSSALPFIICSFIPGGCIPCYFPLFSAQYLLVYIQLAWHFLAYISHFLG